MYLKGPSPWPSALQGSSSSSGGHPGPRLTDEEMIYAAIGTFYLTDEQLRDSPSRKDGIDEATEIDLRVYGCDLIQESGILLKLYAKVSLLPNQQRVDGDISSFRLKLPSPELERYLCVKNYLEKNPLFKNVLLFLVLMGTSMVIGDGILTPSMSVMSAVSGLQGQVPGFDTDAVVIVSILVLLLLFSMQRFGTSKVGFMFAPILALWFLNLGSIGIYNIIKYDISVVKAFNPVYNSI